MMKLKEAPSTINIFVNLTHYHYHFTHVYVQVARQLIEEKVTTSVIALSNESDVDIKFNCAVTLTFLSTVVRYNSSLNVTHHHQTNLHRHRIHLLVYLHFTLCIAIL